MEKFYAEIPLGLQDSLAKFLSSELKLSLYVSGGCTSILGWLTLLPGSSKNMVETQNPYTRGASTALLGYKPENFVDKSVSRDLALKAFINTQKYMYLEADNDLHFKQQRMLGVGITGALRTFNRKGRDHAFISLIDQNRYCTYHLNLDKSNRTREQEDYFIGYNVLNMINNPKNEIPTLVGDVQPNDKLTVVETMNTMDLLLSLLNTQISNLVFLPEGTILVDQVLSKCCVVPGSFNPLNDAHVALAEHAAKKFGVKKNDIIFELSAVNPDEGTLSKQEIEERVKTIVATGYTAMLTVKPFFYSKNEYLKKGFFVVGADTYQRIVDTKYYKNSRDIMVSKLGEFERNQNSLIVAPRLNNQTMKVEGLENFDVPDVIRPWIHELKDFRIDTSSKEKRTKKIETKKNDSCGIF
jgi:hypothetical protein